MLQITKEFNFLFLVLHSPDGTIHSENSTTDDWMAQYINQHGTGIPTEPPPEDTNPLTELEKYLSLPPIPQARCPDPIVWWGVSQSAVYLSL